jgi:hypothetical protein
MNVPIETCACCGHTGKVGMELVPYRYTSRYSEWLCSKDTNPQCSLTRYDDYRKWKREDE